MINGKSGVFEDFYPIDDHRGLITCGPTLEELSELRRVLYSLQDGRVDFAVGGVVDRGRYLRLGSDKIWSNAGVRGIDSPTAHQPFYMGKSILYTDDAPKPKIYKDGEVFIDHWGDYDEVGNPHYHGGKIYFEARPRSKSAPDKPETWEVWVHDCWTGEKKFLIPGANPAVYGHRLFYGDFSGEEYCYRYTTLN